MDLPAPSSPSIVISRPRATGGTVAPGDSGARASTVPILAYDGDVSTPSTVPRRLARRSGRGAARDRGAPARARGPGLRAAAERQAIARISAARPGGGGQAGDRAGVRRPRCWPTGAPDAETARAVRDRVQRGTHPDLTWVTPSGAAEMLVSDIDEPVVAAAARTPFEASRRVFVIEGAETMNEQAANRLLKTLEEPPRTRTCCW